MCDDFDFRIISAEGREDDFTNLVREYTDWVKSQGSVAVEVLDAQNLDTELEDVSVKFGGERGRMLLACAGNEIAGCAAVTSSPDNICEIKRLYVRPTFRGMGLSTKLVSRAIAEAREIGYRFMRLDTFEWMQSAIGLYEKLGFKRIPRYNDNVADDAVFMELEL